MSQVRTYDAKRVVITIGSHTVTGYAEDTFINIEPEGDGTTAVSGADGEVARSLSNNPLNTITLTLQQTSPSNGILSTILTLDKAGGKLGILPFTVRDLRGNTVFAASQCWVTNFAAIEFGSEIGDREWTLMAVATAVYVGGNE